MIMAKNQMKAIRVIMERTGSNFPEKLNITSGNITRAW